jgi:hypothetical protein
MLLSSGEHALMPSILCRQSHPPNCKIAMIQGLSDLYLEGAHAGNTISLGRSSELCSFV